MADDKLSLDQMLTIAAGGTPAPTPAQQEEPEPEPVQTEQAEPVQTEAVNTEATPAPVEEQKETETKPAETKPAETKTTEKPNPMKEIREKYNTEKTTREKIDGAVQRYTAGDYDFKLKDFMVDGKVDYDALLKAMDTADTKVKAEARGITPEVQAEIDRIEKEKVELEKQKLQVSMDRALNNLQQELNLKGADVNNFFKDAMTLKKNPYQWLAQGGSLQDLYYLIYKDTMVKKQVDMAVATARAKWEDEMRRQSKIPAANPAKPTQTTGVNPTGISMEALLEEAARRNR